MTQPCKSQFNNSFTGLLPSGLERWTNIISFAIGENRFNGTLPSAIGEWTTIQSFDVRGNDFTGTIPTSIGNWTSTFRVLLNDNQFNGSVPVGICDATVPPDLEDIVDRVVITADCKTGEVECSCCDCY